MSDRYSRQIALPEIGQGGSGSPRRGGGRYRRSRRPGYDRRRSCSAVQASARSSSSSNDVVEPSNLQRQTLYDEKNIGALKAAAAANHLKRINSDVKIITCTTKIENATTAQLDGASLILDCTDNLETRRTLNAYSVERKVPFIFCTAQGMRGMFYVVDPRQGGRACFACIFDRLTAFAQPAQTGVLGSAVRVAASLQAAEALKLLLGRPCTEGLVSFDVWDLRFEIFAVKRNPACKVCGKKTEKKIFGQDCVAGLAYRCDASSAFDFFARVDAHVEVFVYLVA